jgi:hypothetical protein
LNGCLIHRSAPLCLDRLTPYAFRLRLWGSAVIPAPDRSRTSDLGRVPFSQLSKSFPRSPPPVNAPTLGKKKPAVSSGFCSGRYWARTSDPQLVDPIERLWPVCVRFGLLLQNRTVEASGLVRDPQERKRVKRRLRPVQALNRHCGCRLNSQRRLSNGHRHKTDPLLRLEEVSGRASLVVVPDRCWPFQNAYPPNHDPASPITRRTLGGLRPCKPVTRSGPPSRPLP